MKRNSSRRPSKLIKWTQSTEEDGSIAYWAEMPKSHDMCLCVLIASSGIGNRKIELTAWLGEADDPVIDEVLQVSKSQSMEWVLSQVSDYKRRVASLLVTALEERIKCLRTVIATIDCT